MPKGDLRGGRVASSYRKASSDQRKARDSQLDKATRTKNKKTKSDRIAMAAREDALSRKNLREADKAGRFNRKTKRK